MHLNNKLYEEAELFSNYLYEQFYDPSDYSPYYSY